ncbi:type VI secretion system baseplate subunit TssG, partial [Escherichia coli]|nr:type VI secretion system baseplate subunit TssG [Escherichia coli]
MDGKNRAASSYLSPGNPPADKEQNDPLAQVFHNACSYNFFAMAELLHRLAKGEKGTPELSLRDDPAQETLNRPGFPGECFICELRLP